MSQRVAADDAANGFTLMEMLVVLVIIGLISAVAVPQLLGMLEGAKAKAARIQLETLANSLQFYQMDVGSYPSTEQGLKALWVDPDLPDWAGPYVAREKQLVDPWGHAFIYRAPGKTKPYELITLGADGKEGGRGDDADHSSGE